jgi:hypothetical protein
MPEPRPSLPRAADYLAPELARRIEILEHDGDAGDFDSASWFWLVLFGVVTPAALLLWGWWA